MMFQVIDGPTALGVHITTCMLRRTVLFRGILTSGPMGLCRAGVDAARSFGTGCFATHRTHDLRGLTDQELRVGLRFTGLITGVIADS